MAKTVDLRTYLVLEKAFVRRLQRSWRIHSAPLYAKITQHCLDHQWDKARLLVTDLDMTEVGTQNREWIQYMLLSCAVFGANTVKMGKPSFVGVGTFDTFLKQTTNNILQYLELTATPQIQRDALQLIAEDEAKSKPQPKVAWDEAKHPRDKEGQFTEAGGSVVDMEGRTGMEGGGPERDKWEKLNDAVMEAGDVEWTARDRHVTIASELETKYPKDTPYTEYNNADFLEYLTSRDKALEAALALEDAETALKKQTPKMRIEVVTNLATDVAKRLKIDPSVIDVVDKPAEAFTVGDKNFTEAGHFTPSTGRIELNAQNITYGNAMGVKGIVAHEISHLIYHELKDEGEAEFQHYLTKAIGPDDKHTAWYHERFTRDEKGQRRLRPEFREAFAKEFPASMVLSRLADNEPFTGLSDYMIKENGHSQYAKAYWSKPSIQKRGYETAVNETIAEVTRFLVYPKSYHAPDQPPDPGSPWLHLTGLMHKWYREQA